MKVTHDMSARLLTRRLQMGTIRRMSGGRTAPLAMLSMSFAAGILEKYKDLGIYEFDGTALTFLENMMAAEGLEASREKKSLALKLLIQMHQSLSEKHEWTSMTEIVVKNLISHTEGAIREAEKQNAADAAMLRKLFTSATHTETAELCRTYLMALQEKKTVFLTEKSREIPVLREMMTHFPENQETISQTLPAERQMTLAKIGQDASEEMSRESRGPADERAKPEPKPTEKVLETVKSIQTEQKTSEAFEIKTETKSEKTTVSAEKRTEIREKTRESAEKTANSEKIERFETEHIRVTEENIRTSNTAKLPSVKAAERMLTLLPKPIPSPKTRLYASSAKAVVTDFFMGSYSREAVSLLYREVSEKASDEEASREEKSEKRVIIEEKTDVKTIEKDIERRVNNRFLTAKTALAILKSGGLQSFSAPFSLEKPAFEAILRQNLTQISAYFSNSEEHIIPENTPLTSAERSVLSALSYLAPEVTRAVIRESFSEKSLEAITTTEVKKAEKTVYRYTALLGEALTATAYLLDASAEKEETKRMLRRDAPSLIYKELTEAVKETELLRFSEKTSFEDRILLSGITENAITNLTKIYKERKKPLKKGEITHISEEISASLFSAGEISSVSRLFPEKVRELIVRAENREQTTERAHLPEQRLFQSNLSRRYAELLHPMTALQALWEEKTERATAEKRLETETLERIDVLARQVILRKEEREASFSVVRKTRKKTETLRAGEEIVRKETKFFHEKQERSAESIALLPASVLNFHKRFLPSEDGAPMGREAGGGQSFSESLMPPTLSVYTPAPKEMRQEPSAIRETALESRLPTAAELTQKFGNLIDYTEDVPELITETVRRKVSKTVNVELSEDIKTELSVLRRTIEQSERTVTELTRLYTELSEVSGEQKKQLETMSGKQSAMEKTLATASDMNRISNQMMRRIKEELRMESMRKNIR